jgi:hypothetical protein
LFPHVLINKRHGYSKKYHKEFQEIFFEIFLLMMKIGMMMYFHFIIYCWFKISGYCCLPKRYRFSLSFHYLSTDSLFFYDVLVSAEIVNTRDPSPVEEIIPSGFSLFRSMNYKGIVD